VIDVHGDCQRDAHLFRTSRVVTRFSDRWARPSENDFPISLCTGITEPLAVYWPHLRKLHLNSDAARGLRNARYERMASNDCATVQQGGGVWMRIVHEHDNVVFAGTAGCNADHD